MKHNITIIIKTIEMFIITYLLLIFISFTYIFINNLKYNLPHYPITKSR